MINYTLRGKRTSKLFSMKEGENQVTERKRKAKIQDIPTRGVFKKHQGRNHVLRTLSNKT